MAEPRSLRQLAAFSGITYAQARAAADDGLVVRDKLTWVDSLALRVFLPVQSMVLAGELAPRNIGKDIAPRTRAAVRAVQEAIAGGTMSRDAVLTVGRTAASVHRSLAIATGQEEAGLYGDGGSALLVLPVGQWWWEVQWRE